jgi:hypothetical protein
MYRSKGKNYHSPAFLTSRCMSPPPLALGLMLEEE